MLVFLTAVVLCIRQVSLCWSLKSFTAESCRALSADSPLALSASNLVLRGSRRQGVQVFSGASVQLPVDRDRTWIAAGLALPHNLSHVMEGTHGPQCVGLH